VQCRSGECQDSGDRIDCWPLLLHDVAMNCVNFVKEIDNHNDASRNQNAFLTMPRTGPRDLANQALRYGTIVVSKVSYSKAERGSSTRPLAVTT
jgi:hypothetical protein